MCVQLGSFNGGHEDKFEGTKKNLQVVWTVVWLLHSIAHGEHVQKPFGLETGIRRIAQGYQFPQKNPVAPDITFSGVEMVA